MKTVKLTHKEKKLKSAFQWLIDLLDSIFQGQYNRQEYRRFINQVNEQNRQYSQKFMKAIGAR
jgi:hypothetical protein